MGDLLGSFSGRMSARTKHTRNAVVICRAIHETVRGNYPHPMRGLDITQGHKSLGFSQDLGQRSRGNTQEFSLE